MPDLSRAGSALVMPDGYNTGDLENAKFQVVDGTAYIRTLTDVQIGTAVFDLNYYRENTTASTINAPSLIFRGTGGTLRAVGTADPLPVQEQYAPVYEDNTNGVAAMQQKPVASANYSPTEYASLGGAGGTGVLIKGGAGNVYSVYVTSGTTAIRYFQMFDQGTVAVVGQTPVASYPLGSVPAGGIYELKLDSTHFAPSRRFANGIAVAISSTQGTLGTASITPADYNIHVKYV